MRAQPCPRLKTVPGPGQGSGQAKEPLGPKPWPQPCLMGLGLGRHGQGEKGWAHWDSGMGQLLHLPLPACPLITGQWIQSLLAQEALSGSPGSCLCLTLPGSEAHQIFVEHQLRKEGEGGLILVLGSDRAGNAGTEERDPGPRAAQKVRASLGGGGGSGEEGWN